MLFCEYVSSSIALMVTIVGIPFGLQVLKLSILACWPFGRKVYDLPDSGVVVPVFLNVVWIIFGGIWISLTHWCLGALFYITIIGIPFGKQHFKLAQLSLAPFGKGVVVED